MGYPALSMTHRARICNELLHKKEVDAINQGPVYHAHFLMEKVLFLAYFCEYWGFLRHIYIVHKRNGEMPPHIIYFIILIEEYVTMNDGNLIQSRAETTPGRYVLRNKIGSGGMGDVWLAEDPRLRRQVAIKTLPTHNQSDHEYLQRFAREARAAATLNHPHILLVHDYGEQALPNGQTITYIVMPFVAGGTLSDQITRYTNRGQLMPLNETLSYLSQAADAIDYAHTQGIIHRDIKPRNMLLREDHWLLLTDFGIARILSDQEQLTQTGVGFGTPEYMAPEQAQGRAVAASDIYSLAVIAYQLLTGRLPFTADTAYAITVQHIVSPPPSPRQFNPAIPPPMEQAILQGLAKDPAQRPPSARAFVAALQAAQVDMPAPTMSGSTGAAFSPTVMGASITPTTPIIPTRVEPTETQTELTGTSASRGMSRRALLIGGGAALVLLGGSLGTWEIASQLAQPGSKQPQHTPTPTTRQTTTPAPGPNGPDTRSR
jgi:serine/threonine protein kinase